MQIDIGRRYEDTQGNEHLITLSIADRLFLSDRGGMFDVYGKHVICLSENGKPLHFGNVRNLTKDVTQGPALEHTAKTVEV